MLVSPPSSSQQTPRIPSEATGEEQRDRSHDSSDSAGSSRERGNLEIGVEMSENDQEITKELGVDDTEAACATGSDERNGDAASCATSPAEGDKAGDGNGTHSDGDKGNATLTEGSPPSSIQNDTNQSPNACEPTRK